MLADASAEIEKSRATLIAAFGPTNAWVLTASTPTSTPPAMPTTPPPTPPATVSVRLAFAAVMLTDCAAPGVEARLMRVGALAEEATMARVGTVTIGGGAPPA